MRDEVQWEEDVVIETMAGEPVTIALALKLSFCFERRMNACGVA